METTTKLPKLDQRPRFPRSLAAWCTNTAGWRILRREVQRSTNQSKRRNLVRIPHSLGIQSTTPLSGKPGTVMGSRQPKPWETAAETRPHPRPPTHTHAAARPGVEHRTFHLRLTSVGGACLEGFSYFPLLRILRYRRSGCAFRVVDATVTVQ